MLPNVGLKSDMVILTANRRDPLSLSRLKSGEEFRIKPTNTEVIFLHSKLSSVETKTSIVLNIEEANVLPDFRVRLKVRFYLNHFTILVN